MINKAKKIGASPIAKIDITKLLQSIGKSQMLSGLFGRELHPSQSAWQWVLLEQSTTMVLCCNLDGDITQSYQIDAKIDSLDAIKPWDGNTAVVVGEGLSKLVTVGGIYATLPDPSAQITIENRAYCYDQSLLDGFGNVELITPFAEWLLQALHNYQQWCCVYADRLFVGGSGDVMRELDANCQYLSPSIIRCIEDLKDEQRLHFGGYPIPDNLKRMDWQELTASKIILSWHKLLKTIH